MIKQCRPRPTDFRSWNRKRWRVPPTAERPPDWVAIRRRAIGAHIRAARLHANLTQEGLALRIDLDRSSLNRIEQGHQSPLLDTLIRLADAIGVPLGDLVRD